MVVLVDVRGWSYAKVAQPFDLPAGTARLRLSRGRPMLQRALWEQARNSGIVARPEAGGEEG